MTGALRSRLRVRPATLVVLALLFAAGVAAGAYGDWINWHPMDALMVTLGAMGILLVAGVLAALRNRTTRRVAVGLAALGVGVLAGQIVGPSRPDLMGAEGAITVTLESPKSATGSHDVTCMFTEAGTELQVSGDPNLRLDVIDDNPNAPADIDQRDFVTVVITVGDRWRDGAISRSDNVDLWLRVGRVEADVPETVMVADDASSIDIEWTKSGGALRFANLVPVGINGVDPATEPIDLRGTIEWTCGP